MVDCYGDISNNRGKVTFKQGLEIPEIFEASIYETEVLLLLWACVRIDVKFPPSVKRI